MAAALASFLLVIGFVIGASDHRLGLLRHPTQGIAEPSVRENAPIAVRHLPPAGNSGDRSAVSTSAQCGRSNFMESGFLASLQRRCRWGAKPALREEERLR